MLGRIVVDGCPLPDLVNPNVHNLVSKVCVKVRIFLHGTVNELLFDALRCMTIFSNLLIDKLHFNSYVTTREDLKFGS